MATKERLFSFQDFSFEFEISEYEEAISERDKMIRNHLETIENLKNMNEIQSKRIEQDKLNRVKLDDKLLNFKEKLKHLLQALEREKENLKNLKTFFSSELQKFKSLISNSLSFIQKNQISKQKIFEKLKKFHSLKEMNSIKKKENNIPIPYLSLISENIENLKEKVDHISQNIQAMPTKKFSIHLQGIKKDPIFSSKPKMNNILKSTDVRDSNIINELSHRNSFNQSNFSQKNGQFDLNSPSNTSKFDQIREKYYGLDNKFKSFISYREKAVKSSKEDNIKKTEIISYLKKIDDKLGVIDNLKESSFQGIMNHLRSYQSF